VIVEIIQTHCIPRNNCLLTLINDQGETGFIYFKEGQMIEANYGAIWSTDAFGIMLGWTIAQYHIGELPVGIKRTIWDSVEKLAAQGATAEPEKIVPKIHPGAFSTAEQNTFAARCADLDGFQAMFRERPEEHPQQIAGKTPASVDWLEDFERRSKAINQTLATGKLKHFYIRTPDFQAWKVNVDQKNFIILAEPGAETFENQIRELL
jgi:hypothetical protein